MKYVYTIVFLLAFGSVKAQTTEVGDSVGVHVISCFGAQWYENSTLDIKASVPGWELGDSSLFRALFPHNWRVEMIVTVDEFGDVINTVMILSSLSRDEEKMLVKEVKRSMKFIKTGSGRPPEKTEGVMNFFVRIE